VTAAKHLPDPAEALATLAGSRDPYLVGVRHHSPACAFAMPALLDAASPDRLLVELPADLTPWLPWLAHPSLETPVALASVGEDGSQLGFYPMTDFSPELAAIRWARERGVTVEAFDLPTSLRAPASPARSDGGGGEGERAPDERSGIHEALARHAGADGGEAMWERMVEARAAGSEPERIRRAALLVGFALRIDGVSGAGLSPIDDARERHMRRALASARDRGERTVAVVGAIHAAALLEKDDGEPGERAEAATPARAVVTSLIPYADELLDSRSGYPAGIADPRLQRRLFESLARGPEGVRDAIGQVVVEICRRVRARGHVAGVPDAQEALRIASDLANLRGLPAPGRAELLEALTTALVQGQVTGRGRIVARALDGALVGRRRGALAAGTPRSGLVPHVIATLAALDLPGPGAESEDPVTIRLEPYRSERDRERHVALSRLLLCHAGYAALREGRGVGNTETLGQVWLAAWTPTVDARLALAGIRGATLEQAAAGALATEERLLVEREGLSPRARLELLDAAAEAGLRDATARMAREVVLVFPTEASLGVLLAAHDALERIARGHVPAFATEPDAPPERSVLPSPVERLALVAAAVRALEGLAGSDDLADARALTAAGRLLANHPALGDGRLASILATFAREGSPTMQGVAGALRAIAGHDGDDGVTTFGERVGSWIDGATTPEARRRMQQRLTGMLVATGALFEVDPRLGESLFGRVEALDDDAFLERLASLRGAFDDALSRADRARLLEVLLAARSSGGGRVDLEADPARMAAWARADLAGRAAVARIPGHEAMIALAAGFEDRRRATAGAARAPGEGAALAVSENAARAGSASATKASALSPADRWRLVLGVERERLDGAAWRAAAALDELYGRGHGEGSGEGFGDEARAFPTVREWSEELEDVFGANVREEVVGRAASKGNLGALLAIDPSTLTPSMALLEQVLSLRGGLAEVHVAQLRRVVDRVVDALVEELAVRVAPALSGVVSAHPTRRKAGPLDLRRTVQANIKTATIVAGEPRIVPSQLVFRRRVARALDWHIVLVVDASGSMDRSVIYSAMMAAIFHRLPSVSTSFLAFDTRVVDLSERVDDPLGLLLEVRLGGGTDIALALRHAAAKVKVPGRTLMLLLSDFEDGNVNGMVHVVEGLREAGVTMLGLAALDDAAQPRYCVAVAEQLVAAGMPVAALSPLELARWVGERLRG